MSHAIGFAVTLAASSNLAQYVAWKAYGRRGSHWNRWGPTYLVVASVPLTAADYIRHILLDANLGIAKHMEMYRPGCEKRGFAAAECLSMVGLFVTIICTYVGFACLIVGIIWAADLGAKVKATWRRLRPTRTPASERYEPIPIVVADERASPQPAGQPEEPGAS